jgi:hypothetical protein
LNFNMIHLAGVLRSNPQRRAQGVVLDLEVPSRKGDPRVFFVWVAGDPDGDQEHHQNRRARFASLCGEGDGVTVLGPLYHDKPGENGATEHTLVVIASEVYGSDPSMALNRWTLVGRIRGRNAIYFGERVATFKVVSSTWRSQRDTWASIKTFATKRFDFLRDRVSDGEILLAAGEAQLEPWRNGKGATIALLAFGGLEPFGFGEQNGRGSVRDQGQDHGQGGDDDYDRDDLDY